MSVPFADDGSLQPPSGGAPLVDRHGRPLRNLRLSVTDRCNLRCSYCMPEEDYNWLPREDLLSYEEMSKLVEVFGELGVTKLRLTGGEPLLRRDLDRLIEDLAQKPFLDALALTTNGVLLGDQAQKLRDAGLHRITVSLDTLRADRFQALTRRDDLKRALAGLAAAKAAGFKSIKIDTVVMRGVNDDEIFDLLDFASDLGAELRFIEYMDVGGATRWSMDQVVSREEMLTRIGENHGAPVPVNETTSAPADRYSLSDGTVFGIISSTTQPFCGSCDRSRLTVDGTWYLCLYAATGIDLREPLRRGESPTEIAARIRQGWNTRADRGAEERLAQPARENLVQIEDLRRDPRLEMHTRGG